MAVNLEPSHVSFNNKVKLLRDLGACKRKPRLTRRKSHTTPRNLAWAASSVPTPHSNPCPMATSDTCLELASPIICHPYTCPPALSPMTSAQQPTVPQPIKALSIWGITHCLALRLFIRSEQVQGVGSHRLDYWEEKNEPDEFIVVKSNQWLILNNDHSQLPYTWHTNEWIEED